MLRTTTNIPIVYRLRPIPAQVKTKANTSVVKPNITAKVAAIESRSFQAFILCHYLIPQCVFRGAYNFFALNQNNQPKDSSDQNHSVTARKMRRGESTPKSSPP
jgi:hypothetical protein